MEFEIQTQGAGILIMIAVLFVAIKYKKPKLFWVYPAALLMVYVYNPVKTVMPESSFIEYEKDFSIPEKLTSNAKSLEEEQQEFLKNVEKHNEKFN